MVWLLRYCPRCEKYSLVKDRCSICGGVVKIPHPAKFSMDDHYQQYKLRMRRMAKN